MPSIARSAATASPLKNEPASSARWIRKHLANICDTILSETMLFSLWPNPGNVKIYLLPCGAIQGRRQFVAGDERNDNYECP
jgi:hypothetical protein